MTTSARTRWPLAVAEAVARDLSRDMAPVCERVEIAGSLRRRQPDVGDIELVCLPKFVDVLPSSAQPDMFRAMLPPSDTLTKHSCLDAWVFDSIHQGAFRPRPDARGRPTLGPLNKLLVHVESGIPVDIFTAVVSPCKCGIIANGCTGTGDDHAESERTEPNTVQAELRRLQEVLRGPELTRLQQVVQREAAMGRRAGADAGARVSGSAVRNLPKALSRQELLERSQDLFAGVCQNSPSAGSIGTSGVVPQAGGTAPGWVRDGLRPSEICAARAEPEAQGWLRDGASTGDGAPSGAAIGAMGTSPPPERREGRQPHRESGTRTMQDTQGASDLSSLRGGVSYQVVPDPKCPLCHGTGSYAPNFGMCLFIRTGPAEWNIRAMARFRKLGLRGHAYGGVSLGDGREVACPTEQQVFDLLGWRWVEPRDRT